MYISTELGKLKSQPALTGSTSSIPVFMTFRLVTIVFLHEYINPYCFSSSYFFCHFRHLGDDRPAIMNTTVFTTEKMSFFNTVIFLLLHRCNMCNIIKSSNISTPVIEFPNCSMDIHLFLKICKYYAVLGLFFNHSPKANLVPVLTRSMSTPLS